MANLSGRAASLLQDLAKDHGVGELDFDADGLIPMTIRDTQVALAYSPANDSFFLMSLVCTPEEALQRDPWHLFEACGSLAERRTRLAVEPGGKALMLVREILLARLAYWQLLEDLDRFLDDLAAARGGRESRDPPPPPDFASEMFMIRV